MATTREDSGYVDNWQAGKSVTECNLHMLTTEDCSDVIFRVGSEKHVVRAHRYVLVSRSCVFHAMFCGPLAEKGEVTIPDVELHIFRAFLRYLYAESADITADNVTGLLYTSRKYAVDGLQKQCVAYLKESLSDANVCTILEQCHDYGELDLEQKALKMVEASGPKLVASSGFNKLCSKCMGHFLKSDKLQLKEQDVFTASVSWAEEQCKREEMESSVQNIRQVLGSLIYEIRFPLMSLKFLAKTVGPSGILSNDERVLIMDGIACQDIDVSPFKSTPRGPLQYVNRFSEGTVTGIWNCGGRPDAIGFTVSKKVNLVGFQLYGPNSGKSDNFTVSVKVFDSEAKEMSGVSSPRQTYTLLGEKCTNDILFSQPVILTAETIYHLQVLIGGKKTYRGEQGKKVVQCGDIAVEFFVSKKDKNGTTVEYGQIPGLIIQEFCNALS